MVLIVNTAEKCSRCGGKFQGYKTLVKQGTSGKCLRCGESFSDMCEECQKKGCPKCGGKLESSMDWAEKNNIFF